MLAAIFALLYVRSRKARDIIAESNIRLEEQLKATKALERDMPLKVRDLAADVIKT